MFKKTISLILICVLTFILLPQPVLAQGEPGAVTSVGQNSTFVIKKDGSLWGCGTNEFGQIGIGHDNPVGTFTKVLDGVASVSAAQYHTIAVKRDGTLWGCGSGNDRRLPSRKDLLMPTQILDNVKIAVAGTYYTAAVKTDGSLWICGNFSLGDGSKNDSDQFEKAMDGVKNVFAASDHCLVIKEDDSLWIWGDNNTGQIGNGTISPSVLTATKVMDNVAYASAGSCVMAIQKDGTLWVWGNSGKMYTANGIIDQVITSPVRVMDNVLQFSMSSNNPTFFVLKRDGTVWGWGAGHIIKSLFDRLEVKEPEKVTDNAVSISSESRHISIIKSDLTLWTAGQSVGGRLSYGDITKYDHHKLTQAVKNVLDVPAPWALSEVREAEYRKLVPLVMQNEYTKIVTRSEFCTLAMTCVEQAKHMPVEQYLASKGINIPSSSPFLDIDGLSDRSKKDIMAAYALNVVAGTSSTTFNPNNPITREQAAKMLTATAAVLEQSIDADIPSFTDGDKIANWAKPYIGYVFDAKIMTGVGGNKFDPRGGYQRQQAYMTMLRLYKKITGIE
jgi:alpha-tubulin suppressor-like RCC1 family protein